MTTLIIILVVVVVFALGLSIKKLERDIWGGR